MAKAYENRWGMYCDGDAAYYQERGRVWFEDLQDDMQRFGNHLRKPVARQLVTETQETTAEHYSRARFCMGLREEDYNV